MAKLLGNSFSMISLCFYGILRQFNQFLLNLVTYMHAISMLFLHNGLYEEVVLLHQTTTKMGGKTMEDTMNVFSVQSKGIRRVYTVIIRLFSFNSFLMNHIHV